MAPLKPVVILLCILAFVLSPEGGNGSLAERYSGEYAGDYAFHYAAGFTLGGLAYYYLPDYFTEPWRFLASIALPMLFKTGFEIFDDNPDALDVVEYGVGAGVGILFFTWVF